MKETDKHSEPIAKITFDTFFERATLNPNAELITSLICAYRIEKNLRQ